MSLGWNRGALYVHRKLLRQAQKIGVPVLILSAQKDRVVRNDYQEKFAKKLPNGKMVTLEEATHAMLAGTEKTIAEHVGLTLDFFG